MKEYRASFGDRMSKAEVSEGVRVAQTSFSLTQSIDLIFDHQIDSFLIGPFTDRKTGSFNYRAFCQTLRVTDVDEELARANEKALQ